MLLSGVVIISIFIFILIRLKLVLFNLIEITNRVKRNNNVLNIYEMVIILSLGVYNVSV